MSPFRLALKKIKEDDRDSKKESGWYQDPTPTEENRKRGKKNQVPCWGRREELIATMGETKVAHRLTANSL